MRIREVIGRVIGGALSPLVLGGSFLRAARLFHPDGVVYCAGVKALAVEGEVGALAQRLAGPALVRLSGGMWRWRGGKGERRPDVLGISMRFRASEEITPLVSPGDQDLLFVSARRFALLPVALFTTNRRDFLANDYYAQLPFDVAGLGRAEFRLIPMRAATVGQNRRERLECAAAAGLALLRLEVRRRGLRKRWMAVADVVLYEAVDVDQKALHFSPFHAGRGIVPRGLLQATRRPTYAAGYLGRLLARTRGRGAARGARRAGGAGGARGQ
ncbi:hypothetical protein SOCEGT47_003980 [Sorangium cellulosum]|uniref:Uncharacterized protein n=1 Tax=Sorangium cellulosum TaxID=56 RepID=A0A4P2PU96_SORCE|nr:hypothetical protein [Sorangium cellulosum]AUX19943.1 hypothetical protein SOCEGT47_003980 [Sorangium cellulosum]